MLGLPEPHEGRRGSVERYRPSEDFRMDGIKAQDVRTPQMGEREGLIIWVSSDDGDTSESLMSRGRARFER